MSLNTKAKSLKSEKERNVQVFVRVRPMNIAEKNGKSYAVVNCSGKEVVVKERPVEKHTKTFSFDKVFGPDSKQLDVYKSVVHPLIEEVLAGYNCTVFAYGQTGTGKTFTMEGGKSNDPSISWEDDPLSGIIPRSLSHLFDELRFLQVEHTVRVSFLELYNEEIFDLLSAGDDTTKLRLFEDTTKKGSVIIQGLEELTVHNKNEVYKIMEKGSLKRTTAATLMNAQSSRSHTVFSITVHIKDNSVDGEELLKTGKLNLVDLAGSENIGRSGAIDKRAREAGNINQSLLSLGRCITSLVEHCPHIPYRESKLTRLLQESLGGRTKTSIIATISPALSNLEETLSTLEYAHRAKNITNRPEINQKLSKRALLKEYTEEIERLRRDLEACREKNGVYIAQDNYANMITQIEQQEEEIMAKISAIKAIKEEMDKKEELLSTLNMKLDRARDIICKTKDERDESRHLVEKHLQLEQELTEQAKQLTKAVQLSSNDTEILHQKLERKTRIEEMNMQASNTLANKLQSNNIQLSKRIEMHNENQQQLLETHKRLLRDNYEEQKRSNDVVKNALIKLEEFQNDLQKHTHQLQIKNDKRLNELENHREEIVLMTSKDKENVAETSNHIKNELIVLSEQLNLIYDNQMESMNNLKSYSKELKELSNNCGCVKEDLLAIQTTLHELSDVCGDKLKQIKLYENDAYEKELERNNVLVEKVNTMHNCMENMMKYTCDIKTLLNENNRKTEKHNAMLTEMNEMSTVITDIQAIPNNHINKLIVKNDNINNKLKSFTTELNENTTHNYNKSTETVMTSRDITNSITKNLQDMANNQVSCFDSYNYYVSGHVNEFSDNLKQCKNQLSNRSEELSQQMKTNVDEIRNITEGAMTRENQFMELTAEQFEIQSTQTNTFSRCIDSELKEQTSLLNNYIHNDYQRDFSTGQTPQRRELHYPKHLAVMSPHERLLQRFWTERPARTTLNDTCSLDLEIADGDILNGSDKENECLSSSSCSASNGNSMMNRYGSVDDVTNTSSISDQSNIKKKENVRATLFKKPKSR